MDMLLLVAPADGMINVISNAHAIVGIVTTTIDCPRKRVTTSNPLRGRPSSTRFGVSFGNAKDQYILRVKTCILIRRKVADTPIRAASFPKDLRTQPASEKSYSRQSWPHWSMEYASHQTRTFDTIDNDLAICSITLNIEIVRDTGCDGANCLSGSKLMHLLMVHTLCQDMIVAS